jgi:hypothetical protein
MHFINYYKKIFYLFMFGISFCSFFLGFLSNTLRNKDLNFILIYIQKVYISLGICPYYLFFSILFFHIKYLER